MSLIALVSQKLSASSRIGYPVLILVPILVVCVTCDLRCYAVVTILPLVLRWLACACSKFDVMYVVEELNALDGVCRRKCFVTPSRFSFLRVSSFSRCWNLARYAVLMFPPLFLEIKVHLCLAGTTWNLSECRKVDGFDTSRVTGLWHLRAVDSNNKVWIIYSMGIIL